MWLILPSIFGLVFFIVRIISDDIDDKTDELTASEISVLIYVLLLATMTTFMD